LPERRLQEYLAGGVCLVFLMASFNKQLLDRVASNVTVGGKIWKKRANMTAKRLLQYLIIFIGGLLLINAAVMSLISNFNLGLVALGAFSLALIVYGILWLKHKASTWLHIAVIICCAIVVGLSSFLAIYGSHDNVRYDEDAVIVLGAGVRGERVSSPLAARLNTAVAYHQKNPRAVIVVSGGQGPQENVTEASAMKRYLVACGIPASQIIEEERSTSTYENFSFSNKLLKQRFPGGYAAAFITNDFHVYRAERIAHAAGVSARHLGAPISWYNVAPTYLREILAVAWMWVAGPS